MGQLLRLRDVAFICVLAKTGLSCFGSVTCPTDSGPGFMWEGGKLSEKTSKILAWLLAFMAVTSILGATAFGDVLEPYDNLPGEAWNGAVILYPAYWDYPTFRDENLGDVDVNATIAGGALRAAVFFPKIADKYSWGLLASLPYLRLEADGQDTQTGLGDPGLGLAFWPYSNPKKNFFLSLWWTTYFPLGKYDENNPGTSPGIDAYTFVPAFEVGWYPGKFLFDGVLQYWYFTESDKLNEKLSPFVELDMVFSYSVTDKFIASLQTNAKWDTDDFKVDGVSVSDTQGYVYALGPKFSYLVGDNIMLSITWLHDVDAENRLQGDWIYGRIAWGF